jgi:hypothetical protein
MPIRRHPAVAWTPAETGWAEAFVAALGFAGPIALFAALGQLPLGMGMAAGALTVSGLPVRGGSARGLAQALVPAGLAVWLATLPVGGWAVVLLAFAAALAGGISRPAAVASMRFILFLLITRNIAAGSGNPAGLALTMGLGALWTTGLSLAVAATLRRRKEPSPPLVSSAGLARWHASLRTLAGWSFPLRLAVGLAAAEALAAAWPGHHGHWIALTVALVVQRGPEALPLKAVQRSLGAVLGVLAAGLLFAGQPSIWFLVAALALIAALRPLLKAGNYLAYTAAMTPMVVMLMDLSRPPGPGVLADRLAATLIGAALVVAGNLAMAGIMQLRQKPATQRQD